MEEEGDTIILFVTTRSFHHSYRGSMEILLFGKEVD